VTQFKIRAVRSATRASRVSLKLQQILLRGLLVVMSITATRPPFGAYADLPAERKGGAVFALQAHSADQTFLAGSQAGQQDR
jgi:hypothetical protein